MKMTLPIPKKENDLLRQAMSKLNLSARAYDKILRVARTIADIDGKEDIQTAHLAEAIQYRSLDRNFFKLVGPVGDSRKSGNGTTIGPRLSEVENPRWIKLNDSSTPHSR